MLFGLDAVDSMGSLTTLNGCSYTVGVGGNGAELVNCVKKMALHLNI